MPCFLCTSQCRTNFAGMPLLREMYKAAKRLYSADYYGYTNSDILISASLFPILVETRRHYQNHELTDGVIVVIFSDPTALCLCGRVQHFHTAVHSHRIARGVHHVHQRWHAQGAATSGVLLRAFSRKTLIGRISGSSTSRWIST